MSTASLGDSAALTSLRQQARTWWQTRSQRERQAVVLVACVLAFFVVWSIGIAPASRTIREAPAQLDQLEAQYQQMQRIAAESTQLRGAARVSPTQAATALRAATDRLGDKARLTLQGDRATITLTGISTEALRTWLDEIRSSARARPIEAQLQRGPLGYTGNLSVILGGGS